MYQYNVSLAANVYNPYNSIMRRLRALKAHPYSALCLSYIYIYIYGFNNVPTTRRTTIGSLASAI